MRTTDQRGFSLVEMLVGITILLLAMTGLASLLIQNARVNKSQRMTAEVQANARNSLALVVQKLRSAGWDPTDAGISTVVTDPDLSDTVSEIEIFADLDEDGLTDSDDEDMTIRHVNNQIVWNRTSGGSDIIVANNISNDADGDGTIEPMFVPDVTPNPTRITVRITAQSPAPDPTSKDFMRYTVTSDVVLRKEL